MADAGMKPGDMKFDKNKMDDKSNDGKNDGKKGKGDDKNDGKSDGMKAEAKPKMVKPAEVKSYGDWTNKVQKPFNNGEKPVVETPKGPMKVDSVEKLLKVRAAAILQGDGKLSAEEAWKKVDNTSFKPKVYEKGKAA